jgi:hypothetical protein
MEEATQGTKLVVILVNVDNASTTLSNIAES